MAKVPKAINEALENTYKEVGRVAAEAIKNADKGGSKGTSKAFESLAEMASQYETVDVMIYRYTEPVKGAEKPAFFTKLPSQPIDDIRAQPPELLCKQEGGGGLYKVDVRSQDGRQTITLADKLRISGPSLPTARSDAEANAALSAMGLFPSVSAGLPTSAGQNKSQSTEGLLVDLLKATVKGHHSGKPEGGVSLQDLMPLILLSRQQQESAAPRPDDSVTRLQEQVRELSAKLEQQQAVTREAELRVQVNQANAALTRSNAEWERKFNEMQQTILKTTEDSKLQRLEEKLMQQNKPDSMMEMFGRIYSGSQEDKRSTQEMFLTLLNNLSNKGSSEGTEVYQRLMASQTEQTIKQLNLLTQLASSGLIPQGHNDHPGWTMLERVLGGVERAATTYLGGLPEEEEEEEELEERQVAIERRNEQRRQLQARAQEEQEQEPVEQQEPEELKELDYVAIKEAISQTLENLDESKIPSEAKVSEEEAARVKSSQAWRVALKALRDRENCKETTTRFFALAEGGDRLAQKMMAYPLFVVYQLLTPLGFVDRVEPLTLDLIEFWNHVQHGGDPNEWCETYKPIKKATTPHGTPVEEDTEEKEEK